VGRCRCGSGYRASKSRNARARYWHLLTVPIFSCLPLLSFSTSRYMYAARGIPPVNLYHFDTWYILNLLTYTHLHPLNFHGNFFLILFRIFGCRVWHPAHIGRHLQLQCLFNTSFFRSPFTKASADGAPPTHVVEIREQCLLTIAQAPPHFSTIHSPSFHPPSLIASERSCITTAISISVFQYFSMRPAGSGSQNCEVTTGGTTCTVHGGSYGQSIWQI
jgi:hypothetical protein